MLPRKAKPGAPQVTIPMPLHYVEAKLRARRSRFFEGEKLREAAGAGDVEELCRSVYPGSEMASHVDLERRLRQDCVNELCWMVRLLSPAGGSLYRALIRRFQVDNLKLLLQCPAADRERQAVEGELLELPVPFSLPTSELLEVAEVERFISAVPDSCLRESLEQALDVYEDTGRTAYLEMALDRGYWDGVYRELDALSASSRRACRAPIDAELRSVGLLCVLRSARVYGLSWERVEPLIPRLRTGDQPQGLREVHEDPAPESVLEKVSWLADLQVTAEDAADLCRLEDALWSDVVRSAHGQFYSSYGGPGSVVSYYYLKRAELKKLMGLAEMLRYGKERRHIAERLGLET